MLTEPLVFLGKLLILFQYVKEAGNKGLVRPFQVNDISVCYPQVAVLQEGLESEQNQIISNQIKQT